MGEKDVVKKEEKSLEKLISERIKNNQKIFSEDELSLLEKNKKLLMKIYLLGTLDML